MKAAAFLGKKNIQLVDVQDPVLSDDGVVIRVKACGICGSDLHVYNSEMLTEASTKVIDNYRIIGHEFTGEIVAVGRDVSGFKVGDRVASVHNKGGMAEYTEVHGHRLKDLFKLPDSLGYVTAATLEPMCNPMHSYHLREPGDDETVAVFGAGVIGLGYLQIVKAYSGARIIIVDVSEMRLDAAERIGAEVIINARKEDPVKKIKEITGEHEVRYQEKTAGGCDVTVDAAGLALTFYQSLELLKPEQGTAVIAAVYEEEVSLDPNMVMFKYMTVHGSMGYYYHETEEALSLIAKGRVDRDILISQILPLKDAAEGFALQANPSRSIKVVVVNE
jgi:threonine dehydrogenase-like Zn-dependent dehydrogenase